jgi:hypothetical protein
MSDLFTDIEQELGFAGGGIYFHLYQTSGDLSHLNHALAVWQGAIDEMASDSEELLVCLNLLSYGLSARYERKHNLSDLDEAARLLERSVSLAEVGSSIYVQTLNNLGNVLSMRYEHTADASD